MRHGKTSFRHESLQNGKTIRDILKSISNGLSSGRLTFSDDEDEIIMEPEGLLNLKLTATQEEGRHRVNIRITWQVEDEPAKKKKPLSVSAK
ncbi:MAG: amphi-Trp domain-containing protein [Thiogranum sp.]